MATSRPPSNDAIVVAELVGPGGEGPRRPQRDQLQHLRHVLRPKRHRGKIGIGVGNRRVPHHLMHGFFGMDLPAGRRRPRPSSNIEVLAGRAKRRERGEVGMLGVGEPDDRRKARRISPRFVRADGKPRVRAGEALPHDVVEKRRGRGAQDARLEHRPKARGRARASRPRCPGSCARVRGCARPPARRSSFRARARARLVRPVSDLPSRARRTSHAAFSVAASPGADSNVCTSIATR